MELRIIDGAKESFVVVAEMGLVEVGLPQVEYCGVAMSKLPCCYRL